MGLLRKCRWRNSGAGGGGLVGVVGLVFAVVFGGMILAIMVDRLGAVRRAPATAGSAASAHLERAAGLDPAVPDPAVAGRQLRRFPELASHARGWALVTHAATVVATDSPAAALLLSRASAMLNDGDAGRPDAAAWRSLRLQGEAGLLLAETGRGEVRLAVLARPEATEAEVRAAMGRALERLVHRQGDDGDGLSGAEIAGDAAGPDA